MFRWLMRSALVVLVLLLLALLALPWLADPALRAGLRLAGFEEVRFDRLQVGLGQTELSGVRLGPTPGPEVARLRAEYRLRDLLSGQLGALFVEGLRLHGRVTERGLELSGLRTGEIAGDGALPPLPLPERLVVQDAVVELATPAGTAHLPFEAQLEPSGTRAGFRLEAAPLTLGGIAGQLTGHLELSGSLPMDGPFQLAALDARGQLHLEGEDLAVPDVARGVDASSTIALVAERGRVALSTSSTEVRVASPAARFVREMLPAPWRFRAGTADEPLQVALTAGADGYVLEVDGSMALSAADTSLEARATATLALDDDLDPRALRGASATLSGGALRWRDIEAQSARLELAAEGPLPELQGTAQLQVESGNAAISDLTLRGLTLEQGFDLARSPGRLVLMLKPGGTLHLDALGWQDQLEGGPVTLTPQASDEAFLVIQTEDGRLRGWRQAITADLEANELRPLGFEEPIRLEQADTTVQLRLSGAATGFEEGRLLIDEGSIRLPAPAVRLAGIRSEMALADGGLEHDQTIPIEVATISQSGQPPWFRPLKLQASLRPGPDTIAFDGRLSGAGGALGLSFRGSHEPGSGRSRLVIEGDPVRFQPGKLQPADLVPAFGSSLERVSGQVDLDGELIWRDGDLRTDLALLLEDVGLTAGPARLQQMQGLVRFDSLRPPATPPEQRVSAGRLDVGVPLTQGFMTFRLEPGGPLAVAQLRFRFAGGTLRAEPFRVGSDGSGISVTLQAEGLDLARILEQMQLEGLTGEGRISGRLPVVVDGSEAVIQGGELVSERPGWLRYRPDQPPEALQAGAQGLDLLLQALENFRYEELRITLEGRTDAEMDIQLHIEGANPGLYGGHPIEFNLNLEGELGNILRSNLSGYQIPEHIRRQLESQGQR